MPAAKMDQSPYSEARPDWRVQKIQQLEAELHHLKDQLGTVSLNNANQLLIVNQVYNIALHAPQQTPEVVAITTLLSENNPKLKSRIPSLAQPAPVSHSFSSTQGDGRMTPPITSPDSRASTGDMDPVNEASVNEASDEAPVRSNHGSHGSKDVKSPSADRTPLARGNAHGADLLAIGSACENVVEAAEPQTKEEPPPEKKQANTTDEKKTSSESVEDDDEDGDEIWHEFSLEEELEGIADAPAKDRAAMRAALRVKEEARRQMMRQSAEEKRKIAEREGMHLRKTLLRPALQARANAHPGVPPAEPPKQNSNNNGNGNQKSAPSTSGPSTSGPSTSGPRATASDEDGKNKRGREDGISGSQQPPNAPTETVMSSSIISVESESPKSSTRFGIVFDPSRLDAATTAQISGTAESMDTRRSILIQNIPPEFSMHKLLAHVRGGTVVSARLVPDTLHNGNDLVAMVTFKTAQEAKAGKEITAKLMALGKASEGHRSERTAGLQVSLLPTPTYPSRDVVAVEGKSSSGLSILEETTRCLVVYSFPRQFVNDLCTELLLGVCQFPSKMHALEEMWFAGDALHIHYTSIREAVKAHRIISFFHFGKYSASVHFTPDPCASQDWNAAATLRFGTPNVASHGCMGLKSLLETVGLATYARNQEKLHAQKLRAASASTATTSVQAKSASAVLLPAGYGPRPRAVPVVERAETSGYLVDVSLDVPGSETSSHAAQQGVPDTMPTTTSAPWTDELMMGLDKL